MTEDDKEQPFSEFFLTLFPEAKPVTKETQKAEQLKREEGPHRKFENGH